MTLLCIQDSLKLFSTQILSWNYQSISVNAYLMAFTNLPFSKFDCNVIVDTQILHYHFLCWLSWQVWLPLDYKQKLTGWMDYELPLYNKQHISPLIFMFVYFNPLTLIKRLIALVRKKLNHIQLTFLMLNMNRLTSAMSHLVNNTAHLIDFKFTCNPCQTYT